MAGATPHGAEEMRRVLREQLRAGGVQKEMRRALEGLLREGRVGEGDDEATVLRALQDSGRVGDILRLLGSDSATPSPVTQRGREMHQHRGGRQRGGVFLSCKLLRGKAFLEEAIGRSISGMAPVPNLIVDVQFQGNRARSNPVAASCEPVFGDSFLFEINRAGKPLLDVPSQLHIVVLRSFEDGGSSGIGSATVEWRKTLRGGGVTMSVELQGTLSGANIPIGIIDIRLELVPAMITDALLSDDTVSEKIRQEKQATAESLQIFYAMAKQWWAEYRRISAATEVRQVKIFAKTETGTDSPVMSFVRPLRAGRLLDSPSHAAQFVSLLSSPINEEACGAQSDIWQCAHSVLSTRKGSDEDRACLLCSFFLGFGLDAYVCLGTVAGGRPHTWVMVIGDQGAPVFWEPSTGTRYSQRSKGIPYKTLDCVFNSTRLFTNTAPIAEVVAMTIDLTDERGWKQMPKEAIDAIPKQDLPCILPNMLDVHALEDQLEHDLIDLVTQHRAGTGLATEFDDDLSYVIGPLVCSYEHERVIGTQLDPSEFQCAIKSRVPTGQTFKGFPAHFNHTNPGLVMAAFVTSSVASSILQTRGDKVRFAVRVKVVPYPENAVAVWVMIAVRFVDILNT